MSRALLRNAVEPLPLRLREDVLSYATFVEYIAPELAEDIGAELDDDGEDTVIFLAGVIHLRDLVAGQLALVRIATSEQDGTPVRGVRVGSERIRSQSPYATELRRVRDEIDALLTEASVPPRLSKLSEIITFVASSG